MAAGPLALVAVASPEQFPFFDFKTRLAPDPPCRCCAWLGGGNSRWGVMAGAALPHSLAEELGCFVLPSEVSAHCVL